MNTIPEVPHVPPAVLVPFLVGVLMPLTGVLFPTTGAPIGVRDMNGTTSPRHRILLCLTVYEYPIGVNSIHSGQYQQAGDDRSPRFGTPCCGILKDSYHI